MRTLRAPALSALVFFAASLGAHAEGPKWSGSVYHVRSCASAAAPGVAACHAHVVSDGRGAPMVKAAVNAGAPPGYAPSALRAA